MSNENENPTPGSEEEGKETLEEIKETVEEVVEAVEEKAEAVKEEVEATSSKILSMITGLKEKNPLAFYGGIGAIALIFLGLLFFGGDNVGTAPVPTIEVGKVYTLVNPNVTGGGDVLLLQAPGRMGATDPELREKEQVCVVKEHTPAKVLQETIVAYVKYVQVEPLEGDCAGKKGWTTIVNLQAK